MSQELYKNYVKILSSVEIQNKLFVGENMGIGTLNPTEKLDVVGNTKISGDLHVNSNVHVLSSLTVDRDVTVLGRLSSLGVSYFANTVFSTTSAICAYNTGPGPALYVYQAAGPYDIASFYDGDGVEVLHIGNATPNGNGFVGINNGDPNVELSVKGSISSTELAYIDGDVKIGIEGQRISNLNVTGTISSASTLYVGGSLIQKDLLDVYSTVQSYSGLSWNQNLTFDENTEVIAIRDSNNISLSSITQNNKNYTHANFLPLSGGVVIGDLTITGNVSSLGTLTYIDSQVSITSAIEITNTGTGPALKVTQTGSQDIASFYDDANSVLIIKDGGDIGVGTLNPNKKLTVIGEISSTGAAYIDGNLIQPEFVDLKSRVNTLSSNWNNVYTSVNTTSADWNNVYTSVNNISGNWNNVYTTVYNTSGNWDNSVVISYSDNSFLPLSGGTVTGSVVFLSSVELGNGPTAVLFVSDAKVGINTEIPNKELTVIGSISSSETIYTQKGNSNFWNDVYTSVNATSGIWNNVYTSVNNTSGNWNNVYTSVNNTSGNWNDVYTSVNNTSGNWNDVYTSVNNTSGNWNNVYTSVNNTSGNWNNVYTSVNNTSGNWDKVYTSVNTTSADWNKIYTFVNSSSGLNSEITSFVVGNSSNIIDANSIVFNLHHEWDETRVTVNSLSANWDKVYTSVNNTSANWDNIYTTVQTKSATEWDNTLANIYSRTYFLPLSGGAMTGKLSAAADTAMARLNIGNALVGSTNPTTTFDGDVWINSGGQLTYKSNSSIYTLAPVNTPNTFTSAQIVNPNSTTVALRITQQGTGEAFRVEDDTTPDVTAFIIGSDGTVGIGLSSLSGIEAKLTVVGNISSTGVMYASACIISANSSTDALRITQTGTGNALLVEDSTNPDSTPFIINQYGQIVSGTLSAWNVTAGLQLNSESTTSPNANIALRRNSDDINACRVNFFKTRGTFNTPTDVQQDDFLGTIAYNGYVNNGFYTATIIRSFVDGVPVPSLSSIPSGLTFLTTTSGDNGVTEKMTIAHDGKVGIGTQTPNEVLTVTGNVSATGSITANTLQASVKNFVIKHPIDDSKSLQYSSLESPYIGVRLTGEDKVTYGQCVVNLPDYIKGLIREEDVHILLTNYKHSNIIYVDYIDVENNIFVVKSDNCIEGKEYKFFWSLTGVRKDVPKLQVEI
jgi:hypothetical protein